MLESLGEKNPEKVQHKDNKIKWINADGFSSIFPSYFFFSLLLSTCIFYGGHWQKDVGEKSLEAKERNNICSIRFDKLSVNRTSHLRILHWGKKKQEMCWNVFLLHTSPLMSPLSGLKCCSFSTTICIQWQMMPNHTTMHSRQSSSQWSANTNQLDSRSVRFQFY